VIELVVDETLVRRYGPWVVGVGMHRDAVRSSRRRAEVSPGHNWVTLGVVMRLPFLRCPVAFPLPRGSRGPSSPRPACSWPFTR